MKLAWGVLTKQSDLWVQVLLNKYGGISSNESSITLGQNPSNVWRGIYKVWQEVLNNASFRIRDGSQARFWIDSWVLNVYNLEDHALLEVTTEENESLVKDYVTPSEG